MDEQAATLINDGNIDMINNKVDLDVIYSNYRPGINYDNFLKPKTDRIYEFQSKRVDFRRRPSH